jgi:hypothetical protein
MSAQKTFYHYNDAQKLSGWQIEEFLEIVRQAFLEGKKCYTISSGDTVVFFARYNTSTSFFVANSSGYSRVDFHEDEYHLISKYPITYCRPE